MDRRAALLPRDLVDLAPVRVALAGGRLAQAHGLVGLGQIGGVAVPLGVDDHGPDTEAATGAEDAVDDLGPVGDQEFAERGRALPRITLQICSRSLRGGPSQLLYREFRTRQTFVT